MSKSISTLSDHRIEVYVDKYLQPAEAKALAAEIVAEAEKAEAAKKIKDELGVFAGAKAGDMFISNGDVFVVADPTDLYYPDSQVHLWRVRDQHPTHAKLAYWKDDGYRTFVKVNSYADSFYKTTQGKRGTYSVSV